MAEQSEQKTNNSTLEAADGSPLPYAQAVDELETILAELDSSMVDVDHLAERVRRAADLVRYCRARLDVVRSDMGDVVEDLSRSESSPDA